jgi:hypothetical protein
MPPAWCIGMSKYPYDTKYWKALQAKNLKDAVDPITANEYGGFSDKALKAGDYRIALDAAELGIKFDPNQIWITMNKAHAYMFLDRIEDARKEYLAHRGQILRDHRGEIIKDDGLWERLVVGDFQDLRDQGQEHPFMVEIDRLFKPAIPVEADK